MYIEFVILNLERNYILEQSEIVNLIIETINSIFSNLFSSIDNNVYSYLDTFSGPQQGQYMKFARTRNVNLLQSYGLPNLVFFGNKHSQTYYELGGIKY